MIFASVLFYASHNADAAFAKPKVKESTKYYEIEGLTRDALRAQMNAKGPNGYYGFTNWYVRWTGGCQVSVEVTYTMPKLKKSADTPGWLIESFETFYAALLAHEKITVAMEFQRHMKSKPTNAKMAMRS